MSFGGVMLAMSAVQAISQISQGYAKKAEANYNATIYENQANTIQAQSEIEYGQYNRVKGHTLAKSVAAIGASGIGLGGSAMAVMLNAQTQIGIDQAIGQFNYQQEKNLALNKASAVRREGSTAVATGYTNAFSTILSGASNYAMYKGFGNKNTFTSVGTIKDTTFDSTYNFYRQQGLIKAAPLK